MARHAPVPFSWPVSVVEGNDGTVTVTYAYHDGARRVMVIPATRHGEYDHTTLARTARVHPPPPPSTRPQR